MVCILLLVHNNLHGMIGGSLKHFPKAVCRIIFSICTNILNVKKCEKLFCFFNLRPNASVKCTHTTSTSPIYVVRAGAFFFWSCLCRLHVFVFSAVLKIQSAWNRNLTQRCNHQSPLEFLLKTLRQTTNVSHVTSGYICDEVNRSSKNHPKKHMVRWWIHCICMKDIKDLHRWKDTN